MQYNCKSINDEATKVYKMVAVNGKVPDYLDKDSRGGDKDSMAPVRLKTNENFSHRELTACLITLVY